MPADYWQHCMPACQCRTARIQLAALHAVCMAHGSGRRHLQLEVKGLGESALCIWRGQRGGRKRWAGTWDSAKRAGAGAGSCVCMPAGSPPAARPGGVPAGRRLHACQWPSFKKVKNVHSRASAKKLIVNNRTERFATVSKGLCAVLLAFASFAFHPPCMNNRTLGSLGVLSFLIIDSLFINKEICGDQIDWCPGFPI